MIKKQMKQKSPATRYCHLPRHAAIAGIIFFAVISLLPSAFGEVRMPSLFSDGMVLQRNGEIPVWGWESPGQKVTVSLSTSKAEATAGADGRWKVSLAPLPAGGPHVLTVAGDKNTVKIQDVLIGEVWVCSGQSWMTWNMARVRDAEKEIQAANFPEIRMFTVKKDTALSPQSDCDGRWVPCVSKNMPGLSGLGYFFARDLYQTLGVPIGMIHSSVPGTVAWAWTDRTSLEEVPELKKWMVATDELAGAYGGDFYARKADEIRAWLVEAVAARDKKIRLPKLPEGLIISVDRLDAWQKWLAAADQAKGKEVPLPPEAQAFVGEKKDPRFHAYNQTTMLYNGMIAPLIPYGIKGIIWFQGTGGETFRTMIKGWRKNWGWEMPFYFVQLANFDGEGKNPQGTDWAEIREGQATALDLPNTGMAVAIDIGNAHDLHPTNMQDYAPRLSAIAKAKLYGMNVVYSGPVFEKMEIGEGGKVRVSFQHVGGGLVAKGGELKGFALAGADKKFVAAKAVIDGEAVVVSSAEVPAPVHLRYAFANSPECNLYNKEDLPAAPFRTDTPDKK
jgi:sialate O-acetylesterase